MGNGRGCHPIRCAIGLGDIGCPGCQEKNALVDDISAPGPLEIATVSYRIPYNSRLCFNLLAASAFHEQRTALSCQGWPSTASAAALHP